MNKLGPRHLAAAAALVVALLAVWAGMDPEAFIDLLNAVIGATGGE